MYSRGARPVCCSGHVDSIRGHFKVLRSPQLVLVLVHWQSIVHCTGIQIRHRRCIGKDERLARSASRSDPPQLAAVPGTRRLYSGKIIDVSREVKGGWTIGTVTLVLDDEVKALQSQNGHHVDERPLQLQYQVSSPLSFNHVKVPCTDERTTFPSRTSFSTRP